MQFDTERQKREMSHVLILRPLTVFTMYEKQFEEKFQILKAWESPLPTDRFLASHAHSVKAILCSGFTPITSELLRRLPFLRLVVTESSGVNHIDMSECRRRGISVTNAATAFTEDVADMAVGLLLAVVRRICAADRILRYEGVSQPLPLEDHFSFGCKLEGRRVGIVGLGGIGLEVAKRLEAFGCIISYNSRHEKAVPYSFQPNLLELASNCDTLIICCGLTEQTHHMIDKRIMRAIGKKGILVNIGRGAIIDEKALVECLVNGEIGGAALDVFENEPNVPKELFALENVVISPHRAAFTEESFFAVFQLVVGNLEAFFSNKPLLSPVV